MPSTASTLSTVAAGMAPGTWQEWTGTNITLTDLLFQASEGSTDYVTQYSNKWTYDPTNHKFYYYGGAHGNFCYSTFSSLNEATDTWTLISQQWESSGCVPPMLHQDMPSFLIGHSYQHNALDYTRGVFYAGNYGTHDIAIYTIGTGAWTSETVTGCGTPQATHALEYFPDRDTLLFYDDQCGLFEKNLTTGAWTGPITGATSGHAAYETFAVYSPPCHCVYFGGGHYFISLTLHHVYGVKKYSASGVVTSMTDAPVALEGTQGGVSDSHGGITTVDPVTGDILFWGVSENDSPGLVAHTWQMDPAGNGGLGSWTQLPAKYDPPWFTNGGAGSTDGPVVGTVAVPVAAYGVIVVLDFNSAAPKLWVYKHTDFENRCAASGVVRCFSFDTTGDLAPTSTNGIWGDNYGSWNGNYTGSGYQNNLDGTCGPSHNYQCPLIDSTVAASGGASMKFTQPANPGSNAAAAGQWFANFSADLGTQFGENASFYVQWRQRFDDNFLNNIYFSGGSPNGGWKLADISSGDVTGCSTSGPDSSHCPGSNTNIEIVVQNTGQRGYVQDYGWQWVPAGGGTYSASQPPMSGPPSGIAPSESYQDLMPSPYCIYDQQAASTPGGPPYDHNFSPFGTCVKFLSNQWMTFKVHVQSGTINTAGFSGDGSYPYLPVTVDLWSGYEGQGLTHVHTWAGNIIAPDNSALGTPFKWGKIWLLPYHTSKDTTGTQPESHVWYDELIISTQDIADPAVTSGTTNTASAAMSGKIALGGKVTVH